MMVHEGAVYMHLGETYLVRRLDTEQKVAYVEKQEVDYYTDAAMTSEVAIQEETEKSELPSGLTRHLGELFVVERTPSYVVRKPPGTQPLGSHDLDLPAMEYDTVGLWLTFPPEHLEPLQAASQDPTGALHAVEHALAALVPVVAPCDPRDVGGEAYLQHPDLATPAIFLYDGHAGGVGICEAAYDGLPRLLAAARERLAACGCEDGCPSCVQSPYCGSLNRPMDKRGALTLLGRWTGPDGG
jgi:DEAD/DEAH box helicase domain-containing protein